MLWISDNIPGIWVLLQNFHPENATFNFLKYTNYLIGPK